MRNVGAFLGVAMTLTVLTGAVEAQTNTNCTRIGNTLSCTTIPLGPPSVGGGAGPFLKGFEDGLQRSQEQSSSPVIIIQPPVGQPPAPVTPEPAGTPEPPAMPSLAVSPSKNQATMMPGQRQGVFNSAPIFKLGEPINGIYSLMVTEFGEYEMTMADVRMCLASEICGINLRAFIRWTGVPPQLIGVRP